MAVYALEGIAPVIPSSCWVAPNAQVMGRVFLGEESSLWFGAVARGDNADIQIGARSNIQENAVLHTDEGYPLEIGEDCTIGHGAILHSCILENHVLIGMGAIVLNRSRIGAFSLVGAGALVTEGKSFPSRSLIVGSPAKVVRPLSDEDVEGLKRSALSYVRASRRFMTQFVPVETG